MSAGLKEGEGEEDEEGEVQEEELSWRPFCLFTRAATRAIVSSDSGAQSQGSLKSSQLSLSGFVRGPFGSAVLFLSDKAACIPPGVLCCVRSLQSVCEVSTLPACLQLFAEAKLSVGPSADAKFFSASPFDNSEFLQPIMCLSAPASSIAFSALVVSLLLAGRHLARWLLIFSDKSHSPALAGHNSEPPNELFSESEPVLAASPANPLGSLLTETRLRLCREASFLISGVGVSSGIGGGWTGSSLGVSSETFGQRILGTESISE